MDRDADIACRIGADGGDGAHRESGDVRGAAGRTRHNLVADFDLGTGGKSDGGESLGGRAVSEQ